MLRFSVENLLGGGESPGRAHKKEKQNKEGNMDKLRTASQRTVSHPAQLSQRKLLEQHLKHSSNQIIQRQGGI